jgi:hypothetical protein
MNDNDRSDQYKFLTLIHLVSEFPENNLEAQDRIVDRIVYIQSWLLNVIHRLQRMKPLAVSMFEVCLSLVIASSLFPHEC